MKIEFKQMKIKVFLILLLSALFTNFSIAQNTLNNLSLTSSTPASVAYSLRLLSSSYAGPLVRIKVGTFFYDVYPDASNKFSLTSKISASVSTYNAAAAIAGVNALSTIITGSTDATIAIWYDQSGNGVNVLSSTSTARIITAGSVNTIYGQPTIYFSGGTSLLTSSSTVDFSVQSGATVNVVAQNVSTTSTFAGIIGAAYAIGNPGYNIAYDATIGKGYTSDGAGCAYGGTSSSTSPQLVTNIFTNTTNNLSNTYINGVLKTNSGSTCALTHTSGSRIYIGSARGFAAASFIGNISEAIIFPKQIVDAERNLLETNQTTAYFSPTVTITSSALGSVCAGTNITFTANAYNFTSTPTYQWYKNGTAINGANSSTYSTTTLTNNDVINVSCGNATTIVSDNSLSLWLDAGSASNVSGTTWSDLSGKGNHATFNSHQTYTSTNGGYFQFDGTANPVLINKVTSAITEVTMSAWVYITTGTTQGSFIKNGASLGYTFGAGGGGGFCPGTYPGMLLAGQGWLGSNSPTSNFTTGWQLCTMVISGSSPTTYKYYINGILANTATYNSPSAPNGSYTALGDNYGDGGGCTPFNSKMGAAYIYTKALSQTEIIQNYNASAARFGLSSTSSVSSNTITTTISAPSVTVTSSATGAVCAGIAITFTATVCGIPTPTYQWYKNSAIIVGANASTYSTTTLSNNDQIQVYVNGGINNANIVSSGLKLNIDASNPASYAGTGNTWYDLSGNNNHATLMNSPTYDAASGSIVTNGSNQYIAVPQFNTANTNITVQAWVYVNLNTTGTFIKNGTGGGGYSIGIGNNAYDQVGSNVVMLLYGRGWIATGVSYATAGWKLVTLTLDGSSTARAYVNGGLIGTSYTWPSPTVPAGTLNFGANIGDGNIYYNGKFAAAYFYDRALSLAEIQQNYNAFSTKTTAYSSNTITVSITGSVPIITTNGDACANKTSLTTPSGLTSYAWYKDNVAIPSATSNVYTPTASGAYQVQVTNASCTSTSSATTIYTCGINADGKAVPTTNAVSIISNEGGANFGTGKDISGKLFNTTGITSIFGTIGSSTAVIGGVISPTNIITTSIGVIYSTDINFGTYSSTTIQSNVAAGSYSSTISGLNPLTTYFAKSFIVNKAGTSYGPVVSFATAAPPITVGSVYGSGVVYYILRSGDLGYDANVQHGLIAATTDQSSAVVWAKTNTNIGATAENIGTGLSNTNLIIANQGNTGTYGAKIARDYTGGGYTDWFLPSAQELHQLYLAASLLGANALGSNAYYLSSTEYSTTNFIYEGTMPDYYKTPGNGAYPAGTTKTNNPLRVRAIRYF